MVSWLSEKSVFLASPPHLLDSLAYCAASRGSLDLVTVLDKSVRAVQQSTDSLQVAVAQLDVVDRELTGHALRPHTRFSSKEAVITLPWWFSGGLIGACRAGFPGGASGKEPACQCRRCKGCRFNPRVVKIPWRTASQPPPVSLPGESHGVTSLAGYGP